MSEQREQRAADTTAPAAGHICVGLFDLMAFLWTLAFTGGLALLIHHVGQLSARLAFAGSAGLVAGCVTAWRRLRRLELRRWAAARPSTAATG